LECKRCSDGCPPGMYIARPCTPYSDLVCRACRPLCISEEFEFTPCKGSSNRECRRKDIIPELVIPHKRRVWFEDQRKVKDVSFILTAETLRRLPVNRTIILNRGSGYQRRFFISTFYFDSLIYILGLQVQLEFEMVQLEPILEPVNHSASNDNAHFLASAQEGASASDDLYSRQWFGGSNVDASMLHGQVGYDNWHRANETLSRLCPYPIPPVYHLTMLVHRNVTTATDPDQSLPGYRPILSRCTTYEQHGNFPRLGSNPASSEDRRGDFYGDAAAFVSGFNGDASRADFRPLRGGFYPTVAADDAYVYSAQRAKSVAAEAPSISCLEPSKLPAVFGTEWNDELAAPQTAFYEEKIQCAQLKEACRACLVRCAEEIKSSSLSCKPTAGPADNGRSDRLEMCFDCCAKDNCTYICGKYSAHRCLMRLCSRGTRLDFKLTPEWPKENPFICHVQPSPSRPIYRLRWSLLHNGHPPTKQTFSASLSLNQPISGPQGEPMWSGGSQPSATSTDNVVKRLPDGTLNQFFRGLLNVDYTLGLSHIPDIISGSANTQAAYYWSTQTIPLLQNTMASNYGGSAGGSSSGYSGSSSSYPFLPPFGGPSNDPVNGPSTPSLLVWPSKPFEVNTDLWRKLSAAPCASADHLLEKLNIYTPALAPYIGMTDVQLNFSLSKDSSFLGSIFEPASVERGHSLRASLTLDLNYGLNEDVSVPITQIHAQPQLQQQYNSLWVIDLVGQVSHFPGLFRLKVYPEEAGGSGSGNGGFGSENSMEEIEELEKMPDGDPLLDYEVGVFEENKFELRILIPAPNEEPDYEKSFRLIILDAKNRLDIRVRRAVQPTAEMQQRRMYTVSSNTALVPSLAARQLKESSSPSLGNRLVKRALPSSSPTQSSSSINRVLPIGPPAEVVYVLILFLLFLFIIHVLGHITQPDPSHYWIGCTPAQTSDPNATTSAAIFTFRPPDKVTPLTYWRRVFVLVIYLCLKSAYTFSVTLTALIIVTRYFTREPAQQLASMTEWNGMGRPDHGQSVVSIARQKLLKDSMDAYLKVELRRQQREALEIHKACSAGIDKMFDKMEQAFDVASRRAASRRSRVLISQAVAEYAREASAASVLSFDSGLSTFNTTAQWALRRLRGDLDATKKLLVSSDWLAGARLIYEEVVKLTKGAPDPGDPTKPFLEWAKFLPRSEAHESIYHSGGPPEFSLPPHLPHFDPDKMRIPTPPIWNEAVETGDGIGDAEAFETRYGPSYMPFVSDATDGDNERLAWSVYEDNDPKLDQSETDWPKDLLQSSTKKKRPSTIHQSESASSKSTAESGVVSVFQLNWVHLLCFALFLDGFWLVHRVLHTVDTAERILYGEPIGKEEGLKRRLMKRNRFRKGVKSAFKTFMRPDCVRRICAGALTLLVVCLASAHVKDILSEDMMDVHLHARFVNLHIVSSARRLTHQELATTEAHAEHRYQEAQFLLYHWTGWLNRVETEQCRILLTYKEAARALRSKTEALLGGGAGSQFSAHPPWPPSSSTLGTGPGGFNASASSEAYVPRHCRLTPAEREAELRLLRKLDPPHCPVHVITPRLFQGYNASEYFAEVVAQSRGWLSAVQEWVSVFLTCLFAFVATICLWNALGAVLWFYALRFNIINRKVFYESDITKKQKSFTTILHQKDHDLHHRIS
uniref:TNFR-Cys domain-containing protein n=1 Tax=Hymenolepis diminuta TaxID=6216 RepID=A0A0R3SGJ4_HYMDI